MDQRLSWPSCPAGTLWSWNFGGLARPRPVEFEYKSRIKVISCSNVKMIQIMLLSLSSESIGLVLWNRLSSTGCPAVWTDFSAWEENLTWHDCRAETQEDMAYAVTLLLRHRGTYCFFLILKSSWWWGLCCELTVGILTIKHNNTFRYVLCVFKFGPLWDPRMFKKHPWLKSWKLRCVGVVWAIKPKRSALQNQRRQNQLPLSGDHSDQLGASNKPVTGETDPSPQNWFWDQWDYFFSFCHQWCNIR